MTVPLLEGESETPHLYFAKTQILSVKQIKIRQISGQSSRHPSQSLLRKGEQESLRKDRTNATSHASPPIVISWTSMYLEIWRGTMTFCETWSGQTLCA